MNALMNNSREQTNSLRSELALGFSYWNLFRRNSGSTVSSLSTCGGGKDGNIFVVNRDDMGSFSPNENNVIQVVHTGTQQFNNIFSTPVYWNGSLYYHSNKDVLRAFSWSTSTGLLSGPTSSATPVYSMHGATPSLSA